MEQFLKMSMTNSVTKAFGLEHYIKVFKEFFYLFHFIQLSNYNSFGIFRLLCLWILNFTRNNNFLNSKLWKIIWITDDRRIAKRVRVRSQRHPFIFLARTWFVWNVTTTWQCWRLGFVLSVILRFQIISTSDKTIQKSKCLFN